MPAEVKKEIQLEIAHVLFTDIVGYSKLSINEQHAAVDELTQIVRATEQFKKAEARKTGSLQFPVERSHFLRDDFFPTFREHGCLASDVVYRCFDAIGRRGVDALDLLEQIFSRIQSMQGRSRTGSRVWRPQLL